MSKLVRVRGLHYIYDAQGEEPVKALGGIDLHIDQGEFVAIVGRNGSGKSTLAKCLNGLLLPTQGDVWVAEHNTRDREALCEVRSTVGMVFQNPDNQFVASVVEEEIAFGAENLGVPFPELHRRVERAIQDTGLADYRDHNPRTLSAGDKSRLAIAGILAMQPACIILDESTAMLDPASRRYVMQLLQELHKDGLSVVVITHFMDEAVNADRVVVLSQGRIALQGRPRDVFTQYERLGALGLTLPPAAAIARGLQSRGLALPEGLLTLDELVNALNVAARVESEP